MIRLAALMVLAPLASRAGTPLALTEEEFKAARHYQIALADPRVQKMTPSKRLPGIAKDAGLSVKALELALKRADSAGDVKAKCEANIREGAQAAPFDGRIVKIEVDTAEAHAVSYVQWLNDAPEALEEEAAVLARRAADACPIASSIQVWAQDRRNPAQRVFQALIARSAALRIDEGRAKDFARTRYIKLFENVKNGP